MQKKVEIEIDQMGNTKIEAFGFQGQGCKAATDAIEKALGGGAETVNKPEFSQGSGQQQQKVQQGW